MRDFGAEFSAKAYEMTMLMSEAARELKKEYTTNEKIIRAIEDLDEEPWQEFQKAFAFLMTADEAKELTKAAEERERKAKLLNDFDKINERKGEVAHHAV